MQKDKIKSPFYYFFYPFVYIMAGLILLFHFCLTALELTKTYGLMYGSPILSADSCRHSSL